MCFRKRTGLDVHSLRRWDSDGSSDACQVPWMYSRHLAIFEVEELGDIFEVGKLGSTAAVVMVHQQGY